MYSFFTCSLIFYDLPSFEENYINIRRVAEVEAESVIGRSLVQLPGPTRPTLGP